MGKSVNTIFMAAALAVAVSSCTKDLDYHRDDIEPLLTMNAQLSAADSIHTVSLSISNDVNITAIKSGSVRCLVNGQSVGESWKVDGEDSDAMRQTCFAFKAWFKAGDVVRIEASANDGDFDAWSEVTVPKAPEFWVADTSSIRSEDQSEISDYRVTLKGKDIPDSDSCFSLGLYVPANGFQPYLDIGNDPILMDGGTAEDIDVFGTSDNTFNVFSDNLFKNATFTLSFTFSAYSFMEYVEDDEGDWHMVTLDKTLEITMSSLSTDEYHYLKALGIYQNGGGYTAVTEPVSFPDNVEGGLGMVSISNPATVTIHF